MIYSILLLPELTVKLPFAVNAYPLLPFAALNSVHPDASSTELVTSLHPVYHQYKFSFCPL